MEALTDEVQDVFRYLVINSDWLTNETKVLADEKIQAIIHNIGYADFITDEAKLEEEEIVGVSSEKNNVLIYATNDKHFVSSSSNTRRRCSSRMS